MFWLDYSFKAHLGPCSALCMARTKSFACTVDSSIGQALRCLPFTFFYLNNGYLWVQFALKVEAEKLNRLLFYCFPHQSLQANDRAVPHLGHDCFLPNPFQFIIHLSPYHSMLYHLNTKRSSYMTNPPPPEPYFSCTSNIKVMAEFHPCSTIMKHTELMYSKKTTCNLMTTINLHTFLKQTVTLLINKFKEHTFGIWDAPWVMECKQKKKKVKFYMQKYRIYDHNIIWPKLLFWMCWYAPCLRAKSDFRSLNMAIYTM
jgi:hypothetical protein